jgi:release factor glutamine methyltransferase
VADGLEVELAGLVGSRQEARWILEAAVDEAEARALAHRRLEGEPLQYVLGTWSFRTLELEVGPAALIPRPETEQLVEHALGLLDPGSSVRCVDLGCGSGAIGLSVAAELGGRAEVTLTDASTEALELARRNAERLGLSVSFDQGSWFEALDPSSAGTWDLVVSNPPYVADRFRDSLDPVLAHEPAAALFADDGPAGVPGFAHVAHLIEASPAWLAPGGWLALETSELQVSFAIGHARRAGLVEVRGFLDLSGSPRGIVGRRA